MAEKKFLRSEVLAKRKRIPFAARRAKSAKIFRKLFQDPVFQKARHVALYYGIAPEVETKFFLKKILRAPGPPPSPFRHKALDGSILWRISSPPFVRGRGEGEGAEKKLLSDTLKGKKVYLPRIEPGKKLMTLSRVRSLSKDLVKGPYGIMEPKPSCLTRSAARVDIMLVPGVAFDRQGGRLGRGGGYYDLLLRKAGKVVKVGLCFREQIVKKVPMQAHDVRVDKVITD